MSGCFLSPTVNIHLIAFLHVLVQIKKPQEKKKKKENVVGFLGFGMSFFSVEEMLMKARALSSDAPNLHLCSGGSGKKKVILAMCIQVCGESPKHQIYLKNK